MALRTHLSIVTPTSKRFEGDAELVIAPGTAGDLGALAHHAPLLTTLRAGVVKANIAGAKGDGDAASTGHATETADATREPRRVEFAIDGGFMQVLPDRVIVLTDAAVSRDEVNADAVRAELQRAHDALAQKKGVDDEKERHAVAWAQARLDLIHRPV